MVGWICAARWGWEDTGLGREDAEGSFDVLGAHGRESESSEGASQDGSERVFVHVLLSEVVGVAREGVCEGWI